MFKKMLLLLLLAPVSMAIASASDTYTAEQIYEAGCVHNLSPAPSRPSTPPAPADDKK